MAIEADTVLDFAELQLVPPRNRCELLVSANGITEKLASGLLKPFLTHLQTVEEQVAKGCTSVRLGHPKSLNRKSWFTKGILERFVKFVNTPEVLERVKSIEDELAQLEQVRNIQANSHFQADIVVSGSNDLLKSDGSIRALQKKGSLKPSENADDEECSGEASKVELLRAMDLRVHVLQQEQRCAFDRAVAAGFSNEKMADMIALSEYLGADRFRVACMNFIDMLKAKHDTNSKVDSGDKGNGHNLDKKVNLRLDVCEVSQDCGHDTASQNETVLAPATENPPFKYRGRGSIESRKRWGPPENIRMELFGNRNDTDSASSSESSHTSSIKESPEMQSLLQKNNVEQCVRQKASLYQVNVSENTSSVQAQNALLASQSSQHQPNGNEGKPLSGETKHLNGYTPSFNCSAHETVVKENSRDANLSGSNQEVDKSEGSGFGSEGWSPPAVASARRLSVQDAISLFENKKRRDSVESVGKHRFSKQENDWASSEGAGTMSSRSSVLKRWDSGMNAEAVAGLQGTGSSLKPKVCALDSGRSIDEPAVISIPPDESLRGKHTDSSDESTSGACVKGSSNTQLGPSSNHASWKLTKQEQSTVSEVENKVCDGDWRKQFRLQLEKSLAKDCSSGGSLAEGFRQEHAAVLSMSKKSLDQSILDKANDIKFSASMPLASSKSWDLVDIKARAVPLMFFSEKLNVSEVQIDMKNPESALSELKGGPDLNSKEFETNVSGELPQTLNCARELNIKDSCGSSEGNPLDHDVHTSAARDTHQTNADDEGSEGSKGRLYEQYRKLRDAKLMEDQDSKRAERESKLRIMEETLRRRKAEMDARTVRLSNGSHHQTRSLKVEDCKSHPHRATDKQDGDDGVANATGKDLAKSAISITTSPATPCTVKQVPTSKPKGGRISGVAPQKGATPSRAANRPSPCISPKTAPRGTAGGPSNMQKSMALSRGDNPLTRSVPCFANLRKENTKPSAGRPLSSAPVNPKKKGSGRATAGTIESPGESNGDAPFRTSFSRNGPVKEEKRSRSAGVRKSDVSVNGIKVLSTSNDNKILVPQKGQRQLMPETAAFNNVHSHAVDIHQERKAYNTGQCSDPGLIMPKVSSASDTGKSSGKDKITAVKSKASDSDGSPQITYPVVQEAIAKEALEFGNIGMDDAVNVNSPLSKCANDQAMQTLGTSGNLSQAELDDTVAMGVDDAVAMGVLDYSQNASHTSSIDMETRNCFAGVCSTELESDSVSDPDYSSSKEEGTEAFLQDDEKTVELIQKKPGEESACMSFCSINASPVPLSPASCGVAHEGQLSSHFVAQLESPVRSPFTWASPQDQQIEVALLEKKWVSFTKPAIAPQPKDSVKGFRRLLKFGRKSRASELSMGDCISASTTSEVDDETEENNRLADEVSSRGRICDRRLNDAFEDHFRAKEEGSAQPLRSSIPAPPLNFKMRGDPIGACTTLRDLLLAKKSLK